MHIKIKSPPYENLQIPFQRTYKNIFIYWFIYLCVFFEYQDGIRLRSVMWWRLKWNGNWQYRGFVWFFLSQWVYLFDGIIKTKKEHIPPPHKQHIIWHCDLFHFSYAPTEDFISLLTLKETNVHSIRFMRL